MKKNEEMNQLGYIYHKENPCVVTFISNKQKCHFFFYKISEQEGRTDLAGRGRWWEKGVGE
jgi:hypothetical protein